MNLSTMTLPELQLLSDNIQREIESRRGIVTVGTMFDSNGDFVSSRIVGSQEKI